MATDSTRFSFQSHKKVIKCESYIAKRCTVKWIDLFKCFIGAYIWNKLLRI